MNATHTPEQIGPRFAFASKDGIGRPYVMLFASVIDGSGRQRTRCKVVSCATPRQAVLMVRDFERPDRVH